MSNGSAPGLPQVSLYGHKQNPLRDQWAARHNGIIPQYSTQPVAVTNATPAVTNVANAMVNAPVKQPIAAAPTPNVKLPTTPDVFVRR